MDDNSRSAPSPRSLKEFFRSAYFWKSFLSIVIGGLSGFLYFYFFGCKSGSCAITSDPFGSAITGGILGFLVISSPCNSYRR